VRPREASSLEPGRSRCSRSWGPAGRDGALEEALEVFQRLLAIQAARLTKPELAAQHCRLAGLHEQLGERAAAWADLEKALDADPAHVPALRASVRLAEAAEDWKESVNLRQRLVGVLKGQARFEATVELGEVARDKLKDLVIAASPSRRRSPLRPNELPVMERLVGVYRETHQGPQASSSCRRCSPIRKCRATSANGFT